MTIPAFEITLSMAHDLANRRRDTMDADDLAAFDLMLMLELHKRGAVQNLHLEMSLLADKHQKRAPYLATLLKSISRHIAPDRANVVALTRPTQPPTPKP